MIGIRSNFLKLPLGARKTMNLIESLVLMAASVGLLYFCRGRNGDCLPIFRNWVIGQIFGIVVLYLFVGGLIGVARNLNWLGWLCWNLSGPSQPRGV